MRLRDREFESFTQGRWQAAIALSAGISSAGVPALDLSRRDKNRADPSAKLRAGSLLGQVEVRRGRPRQIQKRELRTALSLRFQSFKRGRVDLYNDSAMAIDLENARERMVVEQLERRGIKDQRVLDAMRRIARHRFLPAELHDHAYDDGPLPIGDAQTISQPYMVALMSEVAELKGVEKVLEVGTGSGYQTAVLAYLAAEVYSIEFNPHLHDRARVILNSMGLGNVFLRAGDGSDGWPEEAPFDVIMVTAAMPGIAIALLNQLTPAGRLIAPIGEDELQTLVRISHATGHWNEEYFGECRFVKMTGKSGFPD